MPAKDRHLHNSYGKCGKSIVKYYIARHRKTCSRGTSNCKKRNCNFATNNSAELSYHIAKLHGSKKPNTLNKCVVCQRDSPSFYSLQFHRRKIHQVNTKVGSLNTTRVRETIDELNEDSEKLKKELAACQHLLVDVHAEHGRHEVFNFSLSKLDTNEINKKLDEVFESHKCAAKGNIALRFLLPNVENNDYRHNYPQ